MGTLWNCLGLGYLLELPWWGSSNEYPQSMFWAEIRKIMYTSVNPSFTIWKWGSRGSILYGHVFVMAWCGPFNVCWFYLAGAKGQCCFLAIFTWSSLKACYVNEDNLHLRSTVTLSLTNQAQCEKSPPIFQMQRSDDVYEWHLCKGRSNCSFRNHLILVYTVCMGKLSKYLGKIS